MGKAVITGIIILAVLAVGIYAFNKGNITGNVVSENLAEMKTFIVTGENFKFVMNGVDNPEIRVKEGDRVRIEFTSTQGFHDFVIDAFGATKQIWAGNSTFVEFTADKKGEYEYYCSVGKHREMGMKAKFIVE